MSTTTTLTTTQAIAAIRAGLTVTAPYHVGGYGPGRIVHTWGEAVLGEAAGPEGYLTLGVDEDGRLVIDESEDWCPPAMRGLATDASGGRHISSES